MLRLYNIQTSQRLAGTKTHFLTLAYNTNRLGYDYIGYKRLKRLLANRKLLHERVIRLKRMSCLRWWYCEIDLQFRAAEMLQRGRAHATW